MPLVLRTFSSARSGQETQSQRTSEELGNRLTFKMEFARANATAGSPVSARVMETLIMSWLHRSVRPNPVRKAEIFQVWSPDQQQQHQCGLGNAHSQGPHPRAAEEGTHGVCPASCCIKHSRRR